MGECRSLLRASSSNVNVILSLQAPVSPACSMSSPGPRQYRHSSSSTSPRRKYSTGRPEPSPSSAVSRTVRNASTRYAEGLNARTTNARPTRGHGGKAKKAPPSPRGETGQFGSQSRLTCPFTNPVAPGPFHHLPEPPSAPQLPQNPRRPVKPGASRRCLSKAIIPNFLAFSHCPLDGPIPIVPAYIRPPRASLSLCRAAPSADGGSDPSGRRVPGSGAFRLV